MIVGVILRLDARDCKGYSSYEYRLLFDAVALLRQRKNMPDWCRLVIYADIKGKEFAKVLGFEDKDIYIDDILPINPALSDSVISLIMSSVLCIETNEPFIIMESGIFIKDFNSIKDISPDVIFWHICSYKDVAMKDSNVVNSDKKASWKNMNKLRESGKYYNSRVIGGKSSPLWLELGSKIMANQHISIDMNLHDVSIFISQYLSNYTHIKELIVSDISAIIPQELRKNISKEYINNANRRIGFEFNIYKSVLEEYMIQEKIF